MQTEYISVFTHRQLFILFMKFHRNVIHKQILLNLEYKIKPYKSSRGFKNMFILYNWKTIYTIIISYY